MRNSRILAGIMAAVLICLAAGLGLSANPFQVTVTVAASTSVTVTTDSISFSVEAHQTGTTDPVNVSVTAYTNKKQGYIVSVAGEAFTTTDGDASTFPLSRLEFQNTNSGNWIATSTDAQAARQSGRTGPSGETFNIPFRLNLTGDEAAGTYRTNVTVTIANL
ncbi:MAG: hypothetical protein K6U03_09635 [Firmicutes bacterium]|nr:hypothetical protein [Bacillota bacterium]